MKALKSFSWGVFLPWQSFKLIAFKPKLIALSALPICLSIGVSSFLLHGISSAVQGGLLGLLSSFGVTLQGTPSTTTFILGFLVKVIAWIFSFLVTVFSFSTLVTILASPFNDWLAEQTENCTKSPYALSTSTSMGWRYRMRLVRIDVSKSLFASAGILLALVCSWIPIVNLFAWIAACLLLCFQYTSYPQTRRDVGLLKGLAFLFQNFPVCLGFGLSSPSSLACRSSHLLRFPWLS